MSIMASISRPIDRAIIATISGDAGTGKTRLPWPKPIFIRSEDGLQSIPENERPDAFPVLKRGAEIWDQLKALLQEEHEYETLVIDSVTSLERLFIQDIMESDSKAKSFNTVLGGYGAGKSALAAMHQRVRKAAGLLNDRKGMNIVFIAHADVETMRLPDQDDYQRYSLRMMDASLPPYVDDVDLVGFMRLISFIRGEEGERKKAISTGDRELICHASSCGISKNRFGLTEALEVPEGVNPLFEKIPCILASRKPSQRKEIV